MSSAHMRLSKGSDSLNFSMRGSVAPVKRPPHSFFVSELTGASEAEACRQAGRGPEAHLTLAEADRHTSVACVALTTVLIRRPRSVGRACSQTGEGLETCAEN